MIHPACSLMWANAYGILHIVPKVFMQDCEGHLCKDEQPMMVVMMMGLMTDCNLLSLYKQPVALS